LAIAVFLLTLSDAGPLAVSGLFTISALWMLLAAPTWCGAHTRKEDYCRNNSYGLLVGCHFRHHKWQRFKQLFRVSQLTSAVRGWFTGAPQQIATCALLVSAMGLVAGFFK